MRHLIFILLVTNLIACGQQTNGTLTKEQKDSIPTITNHSGKIGKDTFEYFTIADTNYLKYRVPDNFKKPKKWKETEEERKGQSGEWYGNTYADTFNLQDALTIIDTEKDFGTVCSAKSWCLKNHRQVFPYLVARLSDKRKVGLVNTADLIIWSRMNTGDLEFYGHGGIITEDIFTIAGRASWILNQLTGEDFAVVHGGLTKVDAEKFKQLWVDYLDK